ncbi:MAG: hypothetical protein ACE37F_05240 [Nannocystaceae bacterium]|nr:hypothetical protein [bacterium]
MYHASLAVQLPIKLPPPTPSVQRLAAQVFPRPREDADDPHEETRDALANNLAVFEGLLGAFADAGFDDVVAIVVDGKPAYVDTEETIGDLQLALEGLVKSKALAKGFAVMRTTFLRKHDGLELLAELRCHARSSARPDETRVRISARPLGHAPERNEGPREYAARVRALLGDAERVESQRLAVAEVRDELAAQIKARMPGVGLEPGPSIVRFIAPGRRQLGRMRHLVFGTSSRRTVYCALPSYERTGPYDDALSRHYYSPYGDLFHWIAVGEVLEGKLQLPSVEVVSATGLRLFRGDDARSFDPADFAVPRDVVRVSPEGRLKIDPSVPEVAALDVSERGSPHSSGWAGEAWADDLDDEG